MVVIQVPGARGRGRRTELDHVGHARGRPRRGQRNPGALVRRYATPVRGRRLAADRRRSPQPGPKPGQDPSRVGTAAESAGDGDVDPPIPSPTHNADTLNDADTLDDVLGPHLNVMLSADASAHVNAADGARTPPPATRRRAARSRDVARTARASSRHQVIQIDRGTDPPDHMGRPSGRSSQVDVDLPLRTSDDLDRIAQVARLRHPDAAVTRVAATGNIPRPTCGWSAARAWSSNSGSSACATSSPRVPHRWTTSCAPCTGGTPPPTRSSSPTSSTWGRSGEGEQLTRHALRHCVRLLGLPEYQGILDLRDYVRRQTARLESDPIYPPTLYVPQRMTRLDVADRRSTDDALAEMVGWLASDAAAAGAGTWRFSAGEKTFLLRELARRMPDELPRVAPVLVELRALEKSHDLDALVASHLAGSASAVRSPGVPVHAARGPDRAVVRRFRRAGLPGQLCPRRRAPADAASGGAGRAKVVVSSRSQHFLTDDAVLKALGHRVEMIRGQQLAKLESFAQGTIPAIPRPAVCINHTPVGGNGIVHTQT